MFKRTEKQKEAAALLSGGATHVMLYGGSRSGKTFYLVRSIILRALKAPNSNHAILRLRFNHCRQSIWHDTFPKVIEKCFPKLPVKENKSEWFLEFENGARIWIGGLDDNARVEKILGNEYSTIYFNECSQIPYHSVTTALTRLAENKGIPVKAYYDCNPPPPSHWTYKVFKELISPVNQQTKLSPENYVSLLMNPADNKENLPDKYIDEILASLPEEKRRRFQYGEWVANVDGAYYESIIAQLDKDGQITAVRYDPAHEVHTWWDIGSSDYTSIWFAQYVGREVRLIRYLQNSGKGPDYYIKELKSFGYNYGTHNLPHDAGNAQFTLGGKAIKQQFQSMWEGQNWKVHKRTQSVNVDIYATRTFLPRCVFDRENCYDGLESLRNYRKTWKEAMNQFSDEPYHDVYSHGADAFRYLAVGYREHIGEQIPLERSVNGLPSIYEVMREDSSRRRLI